MEKLEERRTKYRSLRQNKKWLDKVTNSNKHFFVEVDRITDNGTLLNGFELHHIIPLKDDGTNDIDNLIWIPKAIHRLMLEKEKQCNTRDKVLEFCKLYCNNEKAMSNEEFSKWLSDNMFDHKEYKKQYYNKNKDKIDIYKKEWCLRKKEDLSYRKKKLENGRKWERENRKKRSLYWRSEIGKRNASERRKRYSKTKLGKIKEIKENKYKGIKNSKNLETKMINLFRYQILSNKQQTEFIYWKYEEKEHKIIWLNFY